jgi:hypothetical protein
MELGEVYKEDGEISPEKLFYYHFRKLCNSHGFRGTDGNEITSFVENENTILVKERFDSRLFDNETKKYIDNEKILILFSEEILISNGNNLDYFYGDKRSLKDEVLQKLALEHKNW